MMKPDKPGTGWLLWGSILTAGVVPLAYWFAFGNGVLPAPPFPEFRETRVLEQVLVYSTAVVIKPAYVVLSLLMIIGLWNRHAPDLVALRRGLIAFWLGENACTVNFLLFHGHNELWEYLHNFGMVAAFSFITYSLLEGMDRRLIKYSAPKDRCAGLSLCRACIKYDDVPCGLKRIFTMLIPATMAVAVMPLCAPLAQVGYDTKILGSTQHFAQTLPRQLFEIRYCPWLALWLLAGSWLVLILKRHEPVVLSKILFAAAAGPLGFGLMRLFLFAAYRDDLSWFIFWEEATELIFVLAVGFVLLVFRQSLFARDFSTPSSRGPERYPRPAIESP